VAQQPLANPAGLLKVAQAQTALGDHATPGKWSKGDADQEFSRELREICKNLRLTGLFKERLEKDWKKMQRSPRDANKNTRIGSWNNWAARINAK
jgi:hypothetical protein